jgi:SpoIID/LytB domain protein
MYIVKNRINPVNISRLFFCVIIFSALASGLRAEKLPQTGSDKVKILILSKHIRLLKDGNLQSLQFAIPNGGEIAKDKKTIPCRNLSISYNKEHFSITAGEKTIGIGNFTLYPKSMGDTFSIEINGEKRLYPLPLYIKNTGNEIELSIEETINQFAIDSAWGELGYTPDRDSEALFALAHLIKARCSLPYLTNRHSGYHFCDLTCCQTYKGRSGKIFDDPVSINTSKITSGLFFHSSSGGILFTESIFNGKEKVYTAPKDVIYSENLTLSREKYLNWEATIDEHELASILYPGVNLFLKNITFDMDKEIILIETGNGKEKLAPESFRLKVNRIKGWNFIKSNNYFLSRSNGYYKFTGSGLGHGAGMSFDGALQLAERGYSRYEILEHYYPEIQYNSSSDKAKPRLQYVIFNYDSGEIIRSSGGISFNNRIIPCGSIFKLFIALYMAENRKDLFHNYTYTCSDKEKDKLMPLQCWNKSGHGKTDISSALYNSCNKYFASLYGRIDPDDFTRWMTEFTLKQGIELIIPVIKNKSGFSNLLAGLNFSVTITISGIVKLNRYIYIQNKDHKSEESEIIFNALHKTFSDGTAKNGGDKNPKLNTLSQHGRHRKEIWGKTGTVIAGTNSHHGYGIFTGGISSTGIVSILRKGTGAMAAKESKKILFNNQNYSVQVESNK